MSRAASLWTPVLTCALLASTSGQQRDTPVDLRGPASIAGVVLAADEPGRPLARAAVTLAGPLLRPSQQVLTDEAGRFFFSDLAAGHYTLTASRPPYLTMAFGQTIPGRGSGLPISLRDGESLTGVTWSLPRGAVIAGRILDDAGRPMRHVPVVVMQYRVRDGERRLQTVGNDWPRTDATGQYRVYGLGPGDYVVSAVPPGEYRYIGDGPFPAGATETHVVTRQEIDWALAQLASEAGPARNPFPSGNPPSEPVPGRRMAYGRVFYPGVVDPETAEVVSVGLAEERTGIDFSMRLQPTARVDARVVGPDGEPPADTQIILTMGSTATGSRRTTFSHRNLLPGRYTPTARGGGGALWASETFDVNGQDQTDLVLTLQPSPTMSGRVVVDTSASASVDLSVVRISVRPASPMLRGATADADGSFSVGIDPGRYLLQVGLPRQLGGGWTVASAMWNGQDIVDRPFEIAPGENVSGVVVTLTDRLTELSGRLLDADGRPASGYYVIVFPTDETLWRENSRRQPEPIVAATDGVYRFTGLPPGEYYVGALTSVDEVDLSEAPFLRELAASSATVTLVGGITTNLDLKFARAR